MGEIDVHRVCGAARSQAGGGECQRGGAAAAVVIDHDPAGTGAAGVGHHQILAVAEGTGHALDREGASGHDQRIAGIDDLIRRGACGVEIEQEGAAGDGRGTAVKVCVGQGERARAGFGDAQACTADDPRGGQGFSRVHRPCLAGTKGNGRSYRHIDCGCRQIHAAATERARTRDGDV